MTHWLFFISFCASVTTDNFLWVILNLFLIFTSYWSDKENETEAEVGERNQMVDEIDYLCIFMIALCYLNDVSTNTILLCASGYEGYSKKTINTVKNIAFALAVIKCGIHCKNILILINFICFSIMGLTIYRTRQVYFEKYKDKRDVVTYNLFTLIWRFCALVILLTASYTMEQLINFKKIP